MARVIVILFAMAGAAFLLSRIFPSLSTIAFVMPILGFGVSWLMLTSVGVGWLTYRITK